MSGVAEYTIRTNFTSVPRTFYPGEPPLIPPPHPSPPLLLVLHPFFLSSSLRRFSSFSSASVTLPWCHPRLPDEAMRYVRSCMSTGSLRAPASSPTPLSGRQRQWAERPDVVKMQRRPSCTCTAEFSRIVDHDVVRSTRCILHMARGVVWLTM